MTSQFDNLMSIYGTSKRDNQDWHLKVFNRNTAVLIDVIHTLLLGRNVFLAGLKTSIKPHYERFITLVKECGAEFSKYDVKLKDVERR